jgi:PTH1 family peptidyl-tRNA hydrolase
MADERWLIVGLGNPGPGYAGNRHNAGYLVADTLAGRIGARLTRTRFGAAAATGRLAGLPVIVAKPARYMNLSGGPVASLAGYYKIPASRVVIVHDELDIPFGAIRLKLGGGDNGHNGLRSVTSALRTRDYFRLRIGIGRPPGRQDPANFVLSDFSPAERERLPELAERGADAVQELLAAGLAAAQNRFHAEPLPRSDLAGR